MAPYAGSGTTGPFPYTFKIWTSSELDVLKTDANGVETTLILNTDYTLTGVGVDTGGDVTLTSVLPVGEHLTLIGDTPNLQGQTWGTISTGSLNDSADKLEHQIQQVAEATTRSFQVPRDIALATPYVRPSPLKLLGWDSAGTALCNYNTTTLSVPVIDHIGNHGDSLATAVSDIGSAKQILLINKAITLAAPVTVPSNLELWVVDGGSINRNGFALTINSPFDPGPYRVFYGTGLVTFGTGAVAWVFPQWFGADPTGGSDDSAAFLDAIKSLPTSKGGDIYVPPGVYNVGNIYVSSYARPGIDKQIQSFNLIGLGAPDAVSLIHNGVGNFISMATYDWGGTIKNLKLTSNANTTGLIYLTGCSQINMENLRLEGNKDPNVIGIHMKGGTSGTTWADGNITYTGVYNCWVKNVTSRNIVTGIFEDNEGTAGYVAANKIYGFHFWHTGTPATSTAIKLKSVNSSSYYDCDMESMDQGVEILENGSQKTVDVNFVNCYVACGSGKNVKWTGGALGTLNIIGGTWSYNSQLSSNSKINYISNGRLALGATDSTSNPALSGTSLAAQLNGINLFKYSTGVPAGIIHSTSGCSDGIILYNQGIPILKLNIGAGALTYSTVPGIYSGSTAPENNQVANPGSLYLRSNGTAFLKATGTGNTGWVTVTLTP